MFRSEYEAVKRYDQYCPIAHALGVVGERWTLLVVRELARGPLRYTDLADRLPGIGTNILADRLKELEAACVVEKRKLPPPAASTVYELTEYGAGLRPVLHELARWGARSLGPPPPDALEPGWLVHALDLALSPLCRGSTIAFRVGDEEASLVDCTAVEGIADGYETLVEADAAGLYELIVNRRLDRVRIEGDPAPLERLIAGFSATPAPIPV
ncbi:MAG: helix-turn-helix transcriptional regulator [Actinobacteria bacterium]|nr:helix-turn-helix transcriptional regulator [Actinomycetota bacterium]